MSLNYSIEQQDRTVIIRLNGRLLSDADSQKLTEEINGRLNESIKLLIMDLSGLEHCNSSGLGFIIRTLTRSRINQTEFVISGISGSVATLFEISKKTTLSAYITIRRRHFSISIKFNESRRIIGVTMG